MRRLLLAAFAVAALGLSFSAFGATSTFAGAPGNHNNTNWRGNGYGGGFGGCAYVFSCGYGSGLGYGFGYGVGYPTTLPAYVAPTAAYVAPPGIVPIKSPNPSVIPICIPSLE